MHAIGGGEDAVKARSTRRTQGVGREGDRRRNPDASLKLRNL